jgi:phosphate/sulfate permease
MEINCEQIVENYLLNKNPLYAFRFPLSILISIIIFGVSKAYNWSENSYINQILIPILAFLLTMVLLDIISRLMISKNEMSRLVQICKLWMHDPAVKNHPILSRMVDMEAVSNYNNIENFTIQDNIYNFNMEDNKEQVKNKILEERKNIYVDNVKSSVSEISNVSPFPLEYKKENALCIESSNGCNLCSGSNSNPNNLIAPIPGPQWLPQTAESVQNNLKNNKYTEGSCKSLYSTP